MIGQILVFIGFIIIGIMLHKGKWSFLIAGYNTMNKEEKAKYDEKALCKCIGKFIFFISFCLLLNILGESFNLPILMKLGNHTPLIATIFLLLYLNTGNRFKRKK